MKTLRSLLWVLAFVLGASVASAMNNNDVVKMVKAELDDDTVILAINSAKSSEFDTSANALVELKNKGGSVQYSAIDPIKVAPDKYKVIIDSPQVRVVRARVGGRA